MFTYTYIYIYIVRERSGEECKRVERNESTVIAHSKAALLKHLDI